ncbi:MAG: phosphatase PAP2 family protein [Oscillospiraceae bacterium]|nr:phosphatase PAP2 family protein [Oscillospiraceae bacterium]
MKNQKQWTSPMLLLGVFLAALLVIGSLRDFVISDALYSGELPLWGGILAAVGELPAFCAIAAALTFFLTDSGGKSRVKTVLLRIVSVGLTLAAMALSLREAREGLPQMPTALLIAAIAAIFLAVMFFAMRFFRGVEREKALRFAVTALAFCVLTLLIANGLKYVCCRPRMRLLRVMPAVEFKNWWQFGREQMKLFIAQGVEKSEFRSMPSGHVSGAACSLLWMLLPTLRGKNLSLGAFAVSFLFTAAVAFSRLVMGAHFLTDVTVAWILAYVLFLLCARLLRADSKVGACAVKLLG